MVVYLYKLRYSIRAMISLLQGTVVSNRNGHLTLLTSSGVGYDVAASAATLAQAVVGSMLTLETRLVVKEDALDLYGFVSGDEKQLFDLLITVSGVGPKTALNILALGAINEIAGAIGRGDVTYLTKVSGIGKKTAERLVVELRAKFAQSVFSSESGPAGTVSSAMHDVVAGLEALGYSAIEVRETIESLETAGKTSEQLLREALGTLGKKK